MLKVLPALAALLLVACTSASGPGRGASPGRADPAARIAEQKARLAGSYRCTLESREGATSGTCTIHEDGADFRITMRGAERTLRGTVTATDAGFALEGELDCDGCEPDVVSTDFFEQGDGSYHGVFATEAGVVNASLTRE